MSARSSERRPRPERLRDERGSILVLVAVAMVVILAGAAFALEFGRAYLGIMRLSRAVDAGVLAAARTMRMGEADAEARALAVAAANGVVNGADGVSLSVDFQPNAQGQMTAVMTATRALPMFLGRLMGQESLSISSEAAAASPPVDLVMVIDQSRSLVMADAWDELQDAATTFVDFFGVGYDQLGLVSYHTRGVEREKLKRNFSHRVKEEIEEMTSFGATNMEDGLQLAHDELTGPRVQPGSLKAVVFFTDGYANAYRLRVSYFDLVLARATHGSALVFLYDWLPEDGDGPAWPCGSCFGLTGSDVEGEARERALEKAEELREAGVYVYTIGMKDLAEDEEPDMDLLRRMANENGISDPGQPQAKAYYAPGPDDLEEMFTRVASDLMVHLVR